MNEPALLQSKAGRFIGGFAPPHSPAILLLPFTLVIVYFLVTGRFDEARE
ncbi:hypothetical protein [Methanoculleus sp.]|jgi:hypothetical protein|nr:hypothetical protein [Methanoculleus sp.]